MNRPLVTVLVPTYNRAGLLPRAIHSVIAQTLTDWELVIVDDGSVDRTPDVVEGFAAGRGDRFTFLRQSNRGSSAARNRGIEAARGDFVAFLDSDDEFRRDKLERQVDLFRRRPDLGLVYSDYSLVDAEGHDLGRAFDRKFPLARTVPCHTVTPGGFACAESLFDRLIRGYFVSTITGMVRREVLARKVRFVERISYAEEWLFFLDVSRVTRAGYVDEPLSIHHHTPGSLARADKRRNLAGMRELFQVMKRRYPDSTASQRRAIRANLATVCRQLAHGCAQRGSSEAIPLLFEAMLNHPDRATLSELASGIWRCLGTTQPAAQPVR